MHKLNQKYMDQMKADMYKRLDLIDQQAKQSSKRSIAQDRDLKQTVYQQIRSIQQKQTSLETQISANSETSQAFATSQQQVNEQLLSKMDKLLASMDIPA